MKEAVRHLDNRFQSLMEVSNLERPPKGWIRAIRDALGMTTAQFARRLGVSQPRAFAMERAEISGAITLRSLERAAEVLGCRVFYVFVPDKPLNQTLLERADKIASRKLRSVNQTMRLENQAVRQAQFLKEQKKQLIDKLLESPARLWDEN
jgi:predicted DNA-binding mobile mystery protein A